MSLDEYLEGWVRGTRDAHTDACSITMADGFYFRGYAAGRAAYTEARRAEEERARFAEIMGTAEPVNSEEAVWILQGRLLEAIRCYNNRTRCGLLNAVRIVEAQMVAQLGADIARRYGCAVPTTPPPAPAGRDEKE